jgi:hypothetical protein
VSPGVPIKKEVDEKAAPGGLRSLAGSVKLDDGSPYPPGPVFIGRLKQPLVKNTAKAMDDRGSGVRTSNHRRD